jgi:O-antigen ligase
MSQAMSEVSPQIALAAAGQDSWAMPAARFLLVVSLLAAPIAFGAVQPWAWGSLGMVWIVTLVLWTVGSLRQEKARFVWSSLFLPGLGFLLLGIVQLSFRLTADWPSTRESVLKFGLDLILFFLATQLVAGASTKVLRRFGLTVWLWSFLLGLYSILQFASSRGMIFWTVQSPNLPFGPYINRNHYAGLMEMLIPIAAGYVISMRQSLIVQMAMGLGLVIPVSSMLISGSRGGYTALIAEFFILCLLGWRRLPRRSRSPLLAVGGVGVAGVAALAFWLASADVSQRLTDFLHLQTPNDPSLANRLVVSKDTWSIFKDHPWLGCGLGSFEAVFPQYQSFPSKFRWDHAHNDYAEALAEAGLAGGILILTALVLYFRLAFRGSPRRPGCRFVWVQWGAALSCGGLLIHSLVDFNLHIPANAAWFAICLAIGTTDAQLFLEKG